MSTTTTLRATLPDADAADVVAACEHYDLDCYELTVGDHQVTLETTVPDGAAEAFLTALTWYCGPVTLDEKRPSRDATDIVPVDRSVLSPRQHDTLAAALRLGYYEWHRDTDSEGLADELGVAGPTVSKHRRHAHRKLLTQLFSDE
jgi:predicted DNA binding protein